MNHKVIKEKKNSAGKITITYLKLLYIAFVIKKKLLLPKKIRQQNEIEHRNMSVQHYDHIIFDK